MFEPRTRICATVFAMLATLFSDTWPELAGLIGILLVVLIAAKVPIARVGRNLFLVAWLALFTLGAHLVGTFGGGASLQYGIQTGGIAALRLILLVGWGTVLGASASPLTLVTALEQLLSPLRRMGVPVQSFALVAMLSLRFLPILMYEQQMLVRTYIARGIDLSHESYPNRIKLYVFMCVPVLNHLLRRVEHLSAAMESRGFQARATRTVLRQTHLGLRDYALLCGSALVFGGAVAV